MTHQKFLTSFKFLLALVRDKKSIQTEAKGMVSACKMIEYLLTNTKSCA